MTPVSGDQFCSFQEGADDGLRPEFRSAEGLSACLSACLRLFAAVYLGVRAHVCVRVCVCVCVSV
jgi:hypothetical protein